jgi:hypothetical protein
LAPLIASQCLFGVNSQHKVTASPFFALGRRNLLVEGLGVGGGGSDVSVTGGLVGAGGELELVGGLEVGVTGLAVVTFINKLYTL